MGTKYGRLRVFSLSSVSRLTKRGRMVAWDAAYLQFERNPTRRGWFIVTDIKWNF